VLHSIGTPQRRQPDREGCYFDGSMASGKTSVEGMHRLTRPAVRRRLPSRAVNDTLGAQPPALEGASASTTHEILTNAHEATPELEPK
jgi:hypothetical protein